MKKLQNRVCNQWFRCPSPCDYSKEKVRLPKPLNCKILKFARLMLAGNDFCIGTTWLSGNSVKKKLSKKK